MTFVETGGGYSSEDDSGDEKRAAVAVFNDTELALVDLVLTYPGRDKPALYKYSQSFQRGKIHALVGESGSGKSTALKIIADLVRPDHGTIGYWKGMKVAYVSQDQKLFARTVRENVTYGANEVPVKEAHIWNALETANIAEWVKSLPDGLDEVLVNGEAVVSGGQLQRLNLAHLFCTCPDADLVILDEVLSALDQMSRGFLLERLQTFLEGKTAIITTHHSEMVRICDVVHEMSTPKLATLYRLKRVCPSSLMTVSGCRRLSA